MTAVVTGATGFLGRALLRTLADRGLAVRALVRRDADADAIRSPRVEPLRGDLTEPGALNGLVRGDEVVFHAAARVDVSGTWSDFHRTTVEGTRRLLEAALPRKPRRFVYVSSGAVYTLQRGGQSLCADRTPTRPARYNLYGRAKLQAETLVREQCERAGCPWTIVRLGFLYGPGNRALFEHFLPLLERGRLRIIGQGENRIAAVYVDDAARALLLAGTAAAAAGKMYDVAGDERITQRQFLLAVTQALGVSWNPRRISRRLAFAISALLEAGTRLGVIRTPVNRAAVTLMSSDQVVDSSRIRRELGWKSEVTLAEGVRRTREWVRELRDRRPDAPTVDKRPEVQRLPA